MSDEGIEDVLFTIQQSNDGIQPVIEIRMSNGDTYMANVSIDQMEKMKKEIAIIDRLKW